MSNRVSGRTEAQKLAARAFYADRVRESLNLTPPASPTERWFNYHELVAADPDKQYRPVVDNFNYAAPDSKEEKERRWSGIIAEMELLSRYRSRKPRVYRKGSYSARVNSRYFSGRIFNRRLASAEQDRRDIEHDLALMAQQNREVAELSSDYILIRDTQSFANRDDAMDDLLYEMRIKHHMRLPYFRTTLQGREGRIPDNRFKRYLRSDLLRYKR